jgi:hypothetical protein
MIWVGQVRGTPDAMPEYHEKAGIVRSLEARRLKVVV